MIPLIDKRFRRSSHPLNSLSGIGKIKLFHKDTSFQYPEGIGSPIWRLYKKGYTLLFGVDLKVVVQYI